ncbi:MAG: hypothetical protein EOL87_11080 [Spartobacteria bacterium]|nr:hypothetical protein [Spartobacteria bacterium]
MSSIRWRTVIAMMLVGIIPIILINRYAWNYFRSYTQKELENRMIDTAEIAGHLYLRLTNTSLSNNNDRARIDDILEDLGRDTQSRVQLLSPQGVVRYDSLQGATIGADYSQRLEIQYASQGQYKARYHSVGDRHLVFYYCALPVYSTDQSLIAIAYVSRHTKTLVSAIERLYINQYRATWIALIITLCVACLLAIGLTQRLNRLKKNIRNYSLHPDQPPKSLRIAGHDEMAQLSDIFDQLTAELHRKNTYNRDFVSDILHELKTPVTSIRGATELLLDGAAEDPGYRLRFLENILFETQRLQRLYTELSTLTALDNPNQSEQTNNNYTEFMQATCHRAETAFPQPRAPLIYNPPDKAILARFSACQIEQLLYILLDNAFRYTPPTGCVTLSISLSENFIHTSVTDTGSGISESNINRIFDRFFTTESKSGAQSHGSGLGLSIARRIIENHGGTIRVESKSGQGSTFTFRFPTQNG